MELLLTYISQKRKACIALFVFFAIFLCAFFLYEIPIQAVLYPAAVCTVIGVIWLLLDFREYYEKHLLLLRLSSLSGNLMEHFPEIKTQDDSDYQAIIQTLRQEINSIQTDMKVKYRDMTDYYTIWAHQIKTPIASMRLTLQNEDSDTARQLSEDVMKIEQYVEMVLTFLRLDSDSTDYLFREYDLDGIIKGAVRKFSTQFIRRRISLKYEPLQTHVLTDEKWLSFVIEQVISNAIKYTPEGGTVTIDMEKPQTLCIQDTGIGIAPEDLPRIFEKGYTGYNGRNDKKASGIGLYLCRRICRRLGHKITASSSPESGTVVRIALEHREFTAE